MFRKTGFQSLLAILTAVSVFRECTATSVSCSLIDAVAFNAVLFTGDYAKLSELLSACPLEVLEAAGSFFTSHRQLDLPPVENSPISVDELYGCGANDWRGRLSPLKKDGAVPRPIPDLQTQMDSAVIQFMNKMQKLVDRYGWNRKCKCKSANALEDTFKVLNRLACCKSHDSCTLSTYQIPEEFHSKCKESFRTRLIDLEDDTLES